MKTYSRPYLGIAPPSPAKNQVSPITGSETLSEATAQENGAYPVLVNEEEELVEKETRDRFKKMCEGYFENVSKKLVMEHKV